LCVVLLGLAILPSAALAGTGVTLFNSFAGNIDFVTTGNTLRAGNNASNASACDLQSGLQGTAVNAGTASGTISGIPAGSSIQAAYLYYVGASSTVDSTVTFNGTAVTASRTFTDTTVSPWFGGFVDVTGLVSGNGTYSFTGLTVDNAANSVYCTGSQTEVAGWALVVIFSNPSQAYRVVNVYDGFQVFQNNSITLVPANFKVPSPALSGSKFAVITWEGDSTLSGNETLSFNGTTLTDACNGTNNQYNSTINTILCTGNANTDDVFYGVDIDTFSVDGFVSSGQTSATTFYQSGQDAVVLTAQIISISDAPVSDLTISKVHNGTFAYGANGTYTITVTNTGPTATSGTTKVTDTLPAGETYVSATGTGWSCSAVGQAVTCNSTQVVANGANFNPITLTVAVATSAGTSLVNTATVAVDPADFDNDGTNNSSSDTVSNAAGTLIHPDLSNSTKTVFNPGGGDYNVGDTVQYTITLNESAGVDAGNVSVADDIPANLSGFTTTGVTVTGSSSTVTNSSTNTGGSNGDGLLSISNITVPANGSVTIVFTAQVKTGTANCTGIDNTGTITYAAGSPTTLTVTAPTVTVAQSSCVNPINGDKAIYPYDNLTITRTAPTAGGGGRTINGNTITDTWSMAGLPLQEPLQINAGPAKFNLIMARTGNNSTRTITATLETSGGATIGTGTVSFNSATTTMYTIGFTATATLVPAGQFLKLLIKNNSNNTTNRTVVVSQFAAGVGASSVSFPAGTTANPLVFVKSVNVYNATYPATTTTTVYTPGNTVFVCAVVNDPFGSTDIGSAMITITDSNGTVLVSAAAMTENPPATPGKTNCDGTADKDVTNTFTLGNSYEFAYTVPPPGSAATGFWTATVTGNEGTEGAVSHTANTAFDVDVPSLLIAKSVAVATDPIEGTTRSKAIPGATVSYTIQVQNNGRGPVDSGSLVISDPVPTNTALSLPAKPPFTFTDGATSSGLSIVSGTDTGNITYSNNGGTSYVYTPACTRPCTDSAITNFKITFNGSMNGKTGGTAPSFTITYNVVIQ
jgi:uncharacterized repeat protein (TIGR01451 family)/fimbrial isopeptide formation D2 family protein